MPRELLTLADYEDRAREVMTRGLFQWIDGGAWDEVTFRRINAVLDSVLLRPRRLRKVGDRDTSTTVLGQKISLPVLPASPGVQSRAHPDGELATARAAAAAGTVLTISHGSGPTLEEVAAASGGPRWFQVYMLTDRELTRELIQRAEDAGYSAILLSVDVPLLWQEVKEPDTRNKYVHPPREQGSYMQTGPDGVRRQREWTFDAAATWNVIEWVRSITSLPIIVKGILTPEDGRMCVEVGADGLVVSNHAAHIVDGTITAIEALPEVADAVDGRCEVLIDSGLRRGMDVLKVLALGAKAVLIGRPLYYGLAVAGEEGVRHTFEILQKELDHAMAMCGVRTTDEIDRSLVIWPEMVPFQNGAG